MKRLRDQHNELHIFLEKLKSKTETEAVLLLGGLGKQKEKHSLDKYSDYDISIFLNGDKPPSWLPEFSFSLLDGQNKPVRLMNVYQQMSNSLWDDKTIWSMEKCEAYSNAEVYFDRKGRIGKRIEQIIMHSDVRFKVLVNNLHKINRFVNKNPKKMIYRNSLLSGVLMLNESIKYMFECLFLVNGQHIPHFKWQELDLKTLEWLPESFYERIENAYIIHQVSSEELIRKSKILNGIYLEILNYCQNILPEEHYTFICCEVNHDRQLLSTPAACAIVDTTLGTNSNTRLKNYINNNLISAEKLSNLKI